MSNKSRYKKKIRELEVPDTVKNPDGPGFMCYYCNKGTPFHSRQDAESHYAICHIGPVVLIENLKLEFIYKGSNRYVCLHCGHLFKSKNAIMYHIKLNCQPKMKAVNQFLNDALNCELTKKTKATKCCANDIESLNRRVVEMDREITKKEEEAKRSST